MSERRVPVGVHLAAERRKQLAVIPEVEIRCREQPASSPPLYSRPRFAWNLNEVAGALGDLGTFLPHIIAAITVVGMAPTGVLSTFGLFYLGSGGTEKKESYPFKRCPPSDSFTWAAVWSTACRWACSR